MCTATTNLGKPLLPATAQLGLTEEKIQEVLEVQEEWMREEEQRYEADKHTTGETQNPQWDHYNDDASAQFMPPPHKHHTYNATNDGEVMNNGGAYVTSLTHHVELNNDAAHVEPNHGMIKPLMDELVISGVTEGS
jgi:hypothetical protein